MASITKRGKTYQYTVSRYVDGVYKPIRKGGFRSKPEAKAAAVEVEAQLKKGYEVKTKNMPLTVYFKNWAITYKLNKHPSTFKRYQDTLRILKENFGDVPIQRITRQDYQRLINNFAQGHTKETVRKLHNHVKSCVKDAISEGYIQSDFTERAEIYGLVPAKKDEDKFLEYEDAKKIYEYLFSLADKTKTHYLILLALVTGMRYGEIVGLTRNDFNFNENIITINKTWDYKKGNGFGPTKNQQSERILPVDPKVMGLFKEWFEVEKDNELGLVFFSPHSKSKVIVNGTTNKVLANLLKKLEIENVTMHALRHTHSSILLLHDVSVYYVSERLGHSDINTTLKTYTHILRHIRAKEEKRVLEIFDV